MNAQELLKLAGEASPTLIEKTALAVQLTAKIAPEFVPDVLADFQAILSNGTAKTKQAGLMRDIGTTVAATAAVGLGAAIATDLYNASRRGLTSSRNWKRMIEANPSLREKELAEVRKHFNALHRVAPDISSDPLAAGAAVTRLMGVSDPGLARYDEVLTNVAKSQQDIIKARFDLRPPSKLDLVRTGGARKPKRPGVMETNEEQG